MTKTNTSNLGISRMERKNKWELLAIVTVSVLVSAILGFGSSGMGGHEVIIFPLLEGIFLITYTIALVILSISYYKRNEKKAGNIILLAICTAVGLGYLVFTIIYKI